MASDSQWDAAARRYRRSQGGDVPYRELRERPVGVTTIGILQILGGILGMISGFLLVAVAPWIPSLRGTLEILGILAIVVSLMDVVAGLGLLALKPWAWWFAMILGVVGIIVGALAASWLKFAINAVIVPYLIAVRRHFRSERREAVISAARF